jgi:hypothetical protein
MNPDPELIPLLLKHLISWEDFSRKGRLPSKLKHVYEARRQIVTDLHARGTPWVDIIRVTGLSNGSVQRLTRAMWNPASRANRADNASRRGRARKGESKPLLSVRMERAWSSGKFDFHKGRVATVEQRARLKASFTLERRTKMRSTQLRLWQRPEHRDKMLAYHRSPTVRAFRSYTQAERMRASQTSGRGRGEYVNTLKGPERVWTRSSYERGAILLLDADPRVVSYEYETVLVNADGRRILPDFIVSYCDGHRVLVEIKASWVLSLPKDHRVVQRLLRAQQEARAREWGFEIWTEKDRLQNVVS